MSGNGANYGSNAVSNGIIIMAALHDLHSHFFTLHDKPSVSFVFAMAMLWLFLAANDDDYFVRAQWPLIFCINVSSVTFP